MSRKFMLLFLLAEIALLSVACSSTLAASVQPTVSANPTATLAPSPTTVTEPIAADSSGSQSAALDSTSAYKSQTISGGYVAVEVKPLDLKAGAPSKFEIAMNTHSVSLTDDMLQAVLLRDNSGKEYRPIKWDGPGGGGHHRSGTIEFPVLSSSAKSVTLIVKGIAKVPERTYQWDLQS